MKLLRILLLISSVTSILYLCFVFARNYNSLENIEKRCTIKFQKDLKKGINKSDKEWHLNMDIADNNYFRCMGIP